MIEVYGPFGIWHVFLFTISTDKNEKYLPHPLYEVPAIRVNTGKATYTFTSESGNNTELTDIYRSCLAKGELLVCKTNHDHVSGEQKFGLTKVRPYLFLMLIIPIASKLTR